MKNRYSRIVLNTFEGQDFEITHGQKEEIIINIKGNVTNLHSRKSLKNIKPNNFKTPPIPSGYIYIEGKWNNGFVIERKADKSQFVWIPVGSLIPNGTLDGIRFHEKFGRRFWDMTSKCKHFYEPMTKELKQQIESVDKYGGFYISRYNISMNKKTGIVESIKNRYPLICIDFETAMQLANNFEKQDTVKSHLLFGCEYDSILEWFMDSGARSKDEIFKDSSNWGHFSESLESYKKRYNDYLKTDYWNDPAYWRCYGDEIPISRDESERKKTGTSEEWQTNRIYDLAGNLLEVTQERHFTRLEAPEIVCRGTNYLDEKYRTVVARRIGKDNSCLDHCSYRIALWIK